MRVRTSRQQRLNGKFDIEKQNKCIYIFFSIVAKLQLHNRRVNRHEARNCPICYQLIPLNTDEEYFFTHVQQCSRKVKKKKNHIDRIISLSCFKREQLAANAALAALANQHRLSSTPPPLVIPPVQGKRASRH